MNLNLKKGVTTFAAIFSIAVFLIVIATTLYTLSDKKFAFNGDEIKFKTDLKNFDEEIKTNIDSAYIRDSSVVKRDITDLREIERYSEGLVKSEYAKYAYISNGVLTLRRNMLTEKQITWATEVNIRIDNSN